MIFIESRDGGKGVGFRDDFEGEEMELEAESEERGACFHNNNNDYGDDDEPTVDLDVALSYIDEKLNDLLGHVQKDFEGGVSAENLGSKFGGYGSFLPTYQRSPKTPSKVLAYHDDPHMEGGHHIPVSYSSQSVRHKPDFVSVALVPAPKAPSMNDKTKQEAPISSTRSDKFTFNGQQPASDPRPLKVRIKVGCNNLSTKKNAEIYCGLGLNASPTSSLEASPVDSGGFFHAPNESPTSILEIMTSFPVRGSLLLSPLPYDLLYLTEKEKREDNRSQESTVTAINGSHSLGEKSKSTEKNSFLMESANDIERKDGVIGTVWEAKNMNAVEKNSFFPAEADSDISRRSKTVDRAAQKATSREEDGVRLTIGKATSSSKGKKKSKGSQVPRNVSCKVSKDGVRKGVFSAYKSRNNTYGSKDFKKSNGNTRVTCKDFFGELDLQQNEDMMLEEKVSGDSVVIGQRTVESNREERLYGNRSQKPSSLVYARMGSHVAPATGYRPVSDAALATVAPVVNEDWVFCDKCEKWRLLPPGVNPSCLPEKWLCSMLDWLPGMNRCSVSEEETTKAITLCFPGPGPAQGLAVHPHGPQSGVIPFDTQRHQHIGSCVPSAGVKKKHGSKVRDETKQDRPSLSSNSRKKNLQTSFRSRSLNGVDQSSPINEVEFQDSGQSSSLIVEKHRRKHKEKKKLCENFVDGGNDAHQSKIRKKRVTSQDFKKVKTDDMRRTDEGEAVFKESRSSTSCFPAGASTKDDLEHDDGLKDLKSAESVSSSSLKISNPDKFTSLRRKTEGIDDCQEAAGPIGTLGHGIQFGSQAETSAQGCNEEQGNINHSNANGSHTRKNAKALSSRCESSRSEIDKINLKNAELVNANVDIPLYDEKAKRGRNKSQEKSKEVSVKPLSKQDGQSKHGHHDHDVKQNLLAERDCEKSLKRDVSGREKLNPLPPSGRPIPGSPKENAWNTLSVDAPERNNAFSGAKKIKKTENENGNQLKNMRHYVPSRQKGMDHDVPTLLRRDSTSQAAMSALKEAKDLKHLADRVQNSGSNSESKALYLEAALKFLHGASLLEPCYSESGKHSDMIQSIIMYSSTAKLCEFCAHEYWKSKEMSIASLAYKCAEVAYLKVVYSSHAGACKDRHELQTSLHLTGDSSSAIDLDNLNNPLTVNKVALAKGVDSPQLGGNHVIAAQNKPNFVRLLNFAQDVNFAMEASRKSQAAFAAFSSKLEGTRPKEEISVVKKALDFSFHDVDGLLHLVRLAIEVINK